MIRHLGGTHWMPKTSDSLDNMIFIPFVADNDLIANEAEVIMVDKFKERPLAELNSTQPEEYPKFTSFEHGVIGGLRYAKYAYNNTVVYVFDKRDLSRPRVTTVDYFSLLEYYSYIE